MKRRPEELVLLALLLLGAGVVVAWVNHNRDWMVPIAPGVLLSRNAGDWSLLYDETTPKGLESSLGGTVLVKHLAGVTLIDSRYVIGKTKAGEHFILAVRDLAPNESSESLTERFAAEREDAWRLRCRALGMVDLSLSTPDAVAKASKRL